MKPPTEHQPSSFDLLVTGGTPSGIAAAVRAARHGLTVLLTQHSQHLGGLLSNGIIQWDALSDHRRCPILDEVLTAIETHYRETFGKGSPEHRASRYRMETHPVALVEPGVAERVFEGLVAAEPHITVWRGWTPVGATRDGRRVTGVTLRETRGTATRDVKATVYIDATYEADLAAAAGAAYRVGRESHDDHGEPHAGQLWTNIKRGSTWPRDAVDGVFALHPYGSALGGVDPQSPRTGDAAIQAYNTRPCLVNNPTNRVMIDAPPEDYDRERYLGYTRRYLSHGGGSLIHGKGTYNAPILPGENHDYPDGDWPTRDRITARHEAFALGLIYFLQNDTSIPAEQREHHRQFGLPADEFADNDHLPYEMYVRETRRIVGRHILTENDLTAADGHVRPRCFEDSIGFTDWYMDSHSCTRDVGTWGKGNGLTGNAEYPFDGKLILTEQMRPGMIPYRCLLPEAIDNLLVPVCLSTTHVAWGAVRLEPCWTHLGEVAGLAAALCVRQRTTPAALSVSTLQRHFLDAGGSIAFFNEHAELRDHPNRGEWELAACHDHLRSYHAPIRDAKRPTKSAKVAVNA